MHLSHIILMTSHPCFCSCYTDIIGNIIFHGKIILFADNTRLGYQSLITECTIQVSNMTH